jgi:hypothetical protein
MAAGASREAVVRALVATKEFCEWWFEEELYFFLLLDQFRPATPGVLSIPERLFRREIDVRDAMQEIVISTGFSQRNPGPDTFVTVVLEQLLGITVQSEPKLLAAGKRMYDGYREKVFGREGKSQSDFVGIVIAEPRFATHCIGRHAARLLGKADPKAVADWAGRFREKPGSFPDLLAEMVLSPAYEKRAAERKPKSDHQFLRGLYNDLFERTPDAQELRSLRNALQALADSTPIRSVLVRLVLDSGKAKLPGGRDHGERVDAMFARFLGRAPAGSERQTFVSMLERGECTLVQVARTLLNGSEYQYY